MFKDIKYPIVQAPMAGGILTPELVAAVCNAGMLGSVASGYLSLNALDEFILKLKNLTVRPFLVNIFIETLRTESALMPKPELVIQLENKLGLESAPTFTIPPTICQEEYAKLLIKHQVAYVSSTFGLFRPEVLEELHENGIKVLATVTTPTEASCAAASGVDGVVLQGAEAGGHQGSFLSENVNNIKASELFRQVQGLQLGLPLIVAGGINLGNIKDLWQAGVPMVQLGTLFMLSNLSVLKPDLVSYIQNQALNTNLSNGLTGKWVRGLNNQLMSNLTTPTYSFPLQHYATANLRAAAKALGNYDYAGIWVGEHPEYPAMATCELIDKLIHSLECRD